MNRMSRTDVLTVLNTTKMAVMGNGDGQVRVDVRGERHNTEVIDSVLPAKWPANCQHGRRSHVGMLNMHIDTLHCRTCKYIQEIISTW